MGLEWFRQGDTPDAPGSCATIRSVTDRPLRLAALAPLPVELLQALVEPVGPNVTVVVPETRDREGVRAVLADSDLVLGDWTAGLGLGPEDVVDGPRLRFVQQPSVGVEHYDLDGLAAAGVAVANTAGVNAVSVAEWCLSAALALTKSLVWAHTEVAAGRWPPPLDLPARGISELSGKRVGIIGFGPIGVESARRFAAMGCPVSYWTRRRRNPEEEQGATYRELDDLLASSDVLVVVVALAPTTRGLLDAAAVARLPAGAVLVNAARGGIVDEAAVATALTEGRLAGAAFDVFETEPLPADAVLRTAPPDRLLLSPHASGATAQSQVRVIGTALDNLRRVAAGEQPINVVNGVELGRTLD